MRISVINDHNSTKYILNKFMHSKRHICRQTGHERRFCRRSSYFGKIFSTILLFISRNCVILREMIVQVPRTLKKTNRVMRIICL